MHYIFHFIEKTVFLGYSYNTYPITVMKKEKLCFNTRNALKVRVLSKYRNSRKRGTAVKLA